MNKKKALLISKLVLLSNNTQVFSLRIYTYFFLLAFVIDCNLLASQYSVFVRYLFSLWLFSCVVYNITDIRSDMIVEKIEDYASSEPDENIDSMYLMMELENTERNISFVINLIMVSSHVYFLYANNFKYACMALLVRLILKEVIKALDLRKIN